MKAFVVDTNVPIVANGKAEQADPKCILSCIEQLDKVRRAIVVLDDRDLILSEYMRNLSLSGQPGTGDAFIKWLHDHQGNVQHCERVHITPSADGGSFKEFPSDIELEGFHRDDRKFVAVAKRSRHKAVILNAVDTDWWHFRNALRSHGVRLKFLCPHLMR